jgi:hypothetical protein
VVEDQAARPPWNVIVFVGDIVRSPQGGFAPLLCCLPREDISALSAREKDALARRLWSCDHICSTQDETPCAEPVIVVRTGGGNGFGRTAVTAVVSGSHSVVDVHGEGVLVSSIVSDDSELSRMVKKIVPANTARGYSETMNDAPGTSIVWLCGGQPVMELSFDGGGPKCLARIQDAMFAYAGR